MTIWKQHPYWTDYEISKCGKVRRVVKKYGFIGERKPYISQNGRLMIVMRKPGENKACHVHRLVLETFIGPPPTDKHEGAHSDGNHLNNNLDNLRWATKSENEMDKVRHGTSNRGERSHTAVLTKEQAAQVIVRSENGETVKEISTSMGINYSTTRSIVTKRSWFWMSVKDAMAILHLHGKTRL